MDEKQAARPPAVSLESLFEALSDPLTAVKGTLSTVLLRWDDLPEDQRLLLLARASSSLLTLEKRLYAEAMQIRLDL